MIRLFTGTPGAGKTARAVSELIALMRKDPGRPVFTHNIPELKLPAMQLPLICRKTAVEKGSEVWSTALECEWDAIPAGSLVVIDEAQHVFPRRGSSVRVPGYVSWLNTHRHHGIDIWVITQHPKLLDTAVTALIGQHDHFRRLFGRLAHIAYTWDSCSHTLSGYKDATKKVRRIPRDAFSQYKSSVLHLKHKMSLPYWALMFPILVIAISIYTVPGLIGLGSGLRSGTFLPGAQAAAKPVQVAGVGVPLAVPASASGPQVSAAVGAGPTAASAPAPVEAAVSQASAAPVVVGCMAKRDQCVCYDAAGDQVHVGTDECRRGARGYDGPVKLALGGSADPKRLPEAPLMAGGAPVADEAQHDMAAPVQPANPPRMWSGQLGAASGGPR